MGSTSSSTRSWMAGTRRTSTGTAWALRSSTGCSTTRADPLPKRHTHCLGSAERLEAGAGATALLPTCDQRSAAVRGLGLVSSASLLGVDGHAVTVEVHVSGGLPSFTVVGSPES